MTTSSDHLEPQQIDAFVDRELQPAEVQAVEQHLKACHACTLRVLAAFETKRATVAAASGFTASPESLKRLTAHLRASASSEQASNVSPHAQLSRRMGEQRGRTYLPLWSGLAACLVVIIGFLTWQSRRDSSIITAEILDQHLATLSAAASPQVLSSDRHTVKPWFQGKLPFSFNLPEPAELPPDTILRGADLAYLRDHPVALLLFTVHQHHVSVFVADRGASISPKSSRSGFSVRTTDTAHLQIIAISDVNAEELQALLDCMAKAQQPD